jgi:GNAT superfamily N-acetyltransferase
VVQVQRDDGYIISTDPARLDVNSIHAYIAGESYWARGRSRALMETAIANSLCFGMYAPATGAQVAFARIISDFAVFAYLCDLFVEPAHQGRGLGKWFVQTIVNAPELATRLCASTATWSFMREFETMLDRIKREGVYEGSNTSTKGRPT